MSGKKGRRRKHFCDRAFPVSPHTVVGNNSEVWNFRNNPSGERLVSRVQVKIKGTWKSHLLYE